MRDERFHAEAFPESAGGKRVIVQYPARRQIFSQGDTATDVLYVQEGVVKLSVLSKTGREAVIGLLGPGAFFGEGCLAGQVRRMASATTTVPSTILIVEREEMARLLYEEPAFSDRFLAYVLRRNVRIAEDFVDQLLNVSEKRLARALLLIAANGTEENAPEQRISGISQEVLAGIVGTTRSRVNFFMNKFRTLGFIAYDGGEMTISTSLLRRVLRD